MEKLEKEKEIPVHQDSGGNTRTSNGWKCMAIGSFIGFVGCVLTMLDIIPEARDFWMFGVTLLGVIVAFFGCFLVLER